MITKFNTWLQTHMAVKPSERLSDEHIRKLHLLLGGSFGQAIQQYRAGHRTAPQLVFAIRELVEIDDPRKMLIVRRDEKLAEGLGYAIRMYAEFGKAPDGGELEAWAFRCLANLNRSYGTAARIADPTTRALWESINPPKKEAPPANLYRRKRLQALAA